MRIIATEEHMMTAEVAQAWQALGLEVSDPGVAYHGVGDIGPRLLDLSERRIADMDAAGIDVQVLSLTTPALHDLGPDSVDMARRVNDAMAAAIMRYPDRFEAMATLPMACPEAAIQELERCIAELGFSGAMLCGRAGARNLDHPDFAPVFDLAGRRRVPLLLHPRVAPDGVRNAWFHGLGDRVEMALSGFAIGWHLDAGVQFLRLLLSGLFDRNPDLPIILGHWGELVLYYVDRLQILDRVSGLQQPLEAYLRRNLYLGASGMLSHEHMRRALGIVGPERLLFSTDYPYQAVSREVICTFLDGSGLPDEQRGRFAAGNWDLLTSQIIRS
jgi:predicted TIM-barrel fold metal-dependent hydrolase